jgi:hypothetical protein
VSLSSLEVRRGDHPSSSKLFACLLRPGRAPVCRCFGGLLAMYYVVVVVALIVMGVFFVLFCVTISCFFSINTCPINFLHVAFQKKICLLSVHW